ncbi:hypothetical protein CFOL_v3_17799 [Cephalotus follicularis]|uniref:Uncharacterized protein n=1 Tax=Cephalotus follicularis TaxID=3775 RepID=A0A1Q3C2B3_CEPFO|nr:hypothetical protein CFOL_v3_17799 [Cephalotus follicularis]
MDAVNTSSSTSSSIPSMPEGTEPPIVGTRQNEDHTMITLKEKQDPLRTQVIKKDTSTSGNLACENNINRRHRKWLGWFQMGCSSYTEKFLERHNSSRGI